ncbi:MAG: methyltransferase [Pseudomonadota bacterium]
MSLTQDAFLDGRVSVWQPQKGYRAATDPVLLAAACPAKAGQSVLDLGCGVGVAALCLIARIADLKITGVEIQEDYAELARRNAAENHASLRVETADLADLPASIRQQSFDHVIANPPFFRDAPESDDPGRARARHETTPLRDWVAIAERRLKPKGWLTLIVTTDRVPDLVAACASGFGDMTLLPLMPRLGRPASRVLVKARKGGRGPFAIRAPLILHKGGSHIADGDDYRAEAHNILRYGTAIEW